MNDHDHILLRVRVEESARRPDVHRVYARFESANCGTQRRRGAFNDWPAAAGIDLLRGLSGSAGRDEAGEVSQDSLGQTVFEGPHEKPSHGVKNEVLATGANTHQWDLAHEIVMCWRWYTVHMSCSATHGHDGRSTAISRAEQNRLVQITRWTNGMHLASQFTYDGFGRRVKDVELNNGVVTSTKNFVWDGDQLCEERDGNDNVTKRFLTEGEQIGGVNYYFTFDHLGSIREMIDANGSIRARYDYDPYGRRTKLQGDLDADFGFTGYYVHQPSGLQLALYRAYDADVGRFINRDPIGEDGGLNLYDYVGNDPAGTIDPLGFDPPLVWPGPYPSTYQIALINSKSLPPPPGFNFTTPNPSGMGTIIYDSGLSVFAGGGGGFGVQRVLLDNGQIVTYGYTQFGVGIGFSKGCFAKAPTLKSSSGGYAEVGRVYGVYMPLDYAGAFVNESFSIIAAQSISGSPIIGGGGAASDTYGVSTPGMSGTWQWYWIISVEDPH